MGCRPQNEAAAPDRQVINEVALPELATQAPASAEGSPPSILQGIGLIGASTLDEYRGTENRGGEYAAVTFNMIEQLVILRGFNAGAWGDWDKPRRTGYEYNWARSGATSSTMISQGQHTGLAEQVANGDVTFVMILIGANDFGPHYRNSYTDIYEGKMSGEALQRKIDDAIDNVTLAADTVLEAGALDVAVALFPHWHLEPSIAEKYPDAARRQRVEDAIDQVNEGIEAMAEDRGLIVIDPDAFGLTLLAQLDENGFLNFGGELIDFINRDDEPHHARLADDAGHTGTVLSGLMANYYFIEPLNATHNTNIPPLSSEEILSLAGIRPTQK